MEEKNQGAPSARLLAQLLEIAETADCPNCEIPFGSLDGGCDECQGARAVVEEARKVNHNHDGFGPYSDNCVECVRTMLGFNNEVHDQREKELRREIDDLRDAWFQDEGIAPDGNLRAIVSRTVARAAGLQSLLAKIHRLSDPNGEPQVHPAQPAPEAVEKLLDDCDSAAAQGEEK